MLFNLDKIKFDEQGLVPCIVQDFKTWDILMFAYMNREAAELSWKTCKATFYSRSRQEIWVKGESHGTFLPIASMFLDCDCDTVLMLVNCPVNYNVCHTGMETCFGPKYFGIDRLAKFIDSYADDTLPSNYTKSLLNDPEKAAQKVGEEAVETVIEAIKGDKDRFIYESADLIYHLLVLMKTQDISLKDIENELYKRHQAKK